MHTILVTGGAGFLGGWYVRHALAAGVERLVVLDKLTYAGSRASLVEVENDPRFVFRQGDIGDGSLVASLLDRFQPRTIVNFAAETHVDRSIDAPAPFVATNVVGTSVLLEQSCTYWQQCSSDQRRGFRLIHISTDEVFGPIAAPLAIDESARYRPSSPYAASKAAADHFVLAYHHTYGLPAVLVHPSNCYGPFQFPEKLVPLVILNAVEGKPLPVYGDGKQQRDWLFAGDLCPAIDLVIQHAAPGEEYNVATGTLLPNRQLVGEICDIVDRLMPGLPHSPCSLLIEHAHDRPGHDYRYALDTQKIRALGWVPSVEITRGLELTVQWYVDNRAWVDAVARSFDRTRRLGLP